MCVHTFINENLLQRYTFFMIYANKFKEKSLKTPKHRIAI